MRLLPSTIIICTTAIMMIANQATAYCAKCVKIEEERAREQAEHPQQIGYYDDQIGLHKETKRNASNTMIVDVSSQDNALKKSTNESGSLTGSSYRSSGINATESGKSTVGLHPDQNASKENPSNTQKANVPSTEENSQDDFFEDDEVIQSRSSQANALDVQIDPRLYSTISTILQTKNFITVLENGNFTLFIPSNEAIQRLPPRVIQDLLRPENREKLSALVSNHIVNQRIMLNNLKSAQVKTLEGRNLDIRSLNGDLTINGAHIIDIKPAGNNGVIYIIDRVFAP